MARSLGLTAYRALARRGEVDTTPIKTPRPKGELLWIHAAEPGNQLAIFDLATRLCAMRYDLNVMITLPDEMSLARPAALQKSIILSRQPGEHPDSVTRFMDHWQPDACLWFWGALRPNLILDAAARNCPMILADADAKGFDGRRDRWLTDLTRALLKKFTAVLARSVRGRRRLIQLGVPAAEVAETSPLMAGGHALTCADSDVSELAEVLGGRPVWFAANLHPQEVATVLAAHRQASRLSHRLLLILTPSDPKDALGVAEQAADLGLDVVLWDDLGEPDDTTQVLVAENASERGLFFRVAPVSFLGSSLVPGQGGVDPFEAAALGSAILYGPKVRDFMPSYTRLAAAGAARIVNDAAALGTAVSHLIAPDQAATMAHAGWDVISQGAELTDRIIDLVQDALDEAAVQP